MIKFPSPTTIAISGSTMSGKTTFVNKLLDHAADMFEQVPANVLYCYGVWQSLFTTMESKYDWLTFHEGLPSEELVRDLTTNGKHNLVIVDDLMDQVVKSSEMETLFTRGAHHRNLTLIYINQNMYCQGKNARTMSLNTHFMVLMKNPRDASQVQTLGKQVFPNQSQILTEAYRDCMTRPYSYLLVDLSPQCLDQYRLRSNIFPGEYTTVYIAK